MEEAHSGSAAHLTPTVRVATFLRTCQKMNLINKPDWVVWLCPTKLWKMPCESYNLAFDKVTWRVLEQQRHYLIQYLLACNNQTTTSNWRAFILSRVTSINHKKTEWSSDLCYNINGLWKCDAEVKKSQTQKGKYYMIPFIWNSQSS